LIKTAYALYHQQLPPSLHFTRANPEVNLDSGPFYVNTTLTPWPRRADSPRRAGTSSFGLGGTNAHLVLEEAPECSPGSVSRPGQLLVLSARTPTALEQQSKNLAQHLRDHPQLELADIAYTLQVGRSVFPDRRVLVCAERDEAIAALEQPLAASSGVRHDPAKERHVAFLLAGTGEQYTDIAHDLYIHERFFREQVEHCLAILKQRAGLDLSTLLFSGANRRHRQRAGLDLKALLRPDTSANPAEQELRQTIFAQPAIFVIEYALVQLLMHWGILPQALLGYSLGEYVAACVAGVFSLEDALLLVARRAQWIQDQAPGAMIAVELSAAEVRPFVHTPVEVAIIGGLQHCVLAGPPQAIAELAEQLQTLGIAARPLETTHAFHTSMLAPVQEALTTLARSIQLHAPTIPYISNLTGTWITREQAMDPGYWAEHMCQPVNFLSGIDTLLQEKQQVMLEIGPGQALSSVVRQHLASRTDPYDLVFSTLPSRYERLSDIQALLATLGKLWLAGVQPDWSAFYDQEQRLRVPLPTYPFERQRYWIDAPQGQGQPRTSARSESGKKAASADWFYLPLWKQTPLVEELPLTDAGPCLVFMDTAGLGEQLASELRGRGLQVIGVVARDSFASLDAQTYGLRAGEASDYEALSRELKRRQSLPRTIVHCWSVEQEDPLAAGLAYFQSRQKAGFYSLLFFLQALSAQAYTQPLRIFVLSSHIHAVHGLKRPRFSACVESSPRNISIPPAAISMSFCLMARPGIGVCSQRCSARFSAHAQTRLWPIAAGRAGSRSIKQSAWQVSCSRPVLCASRGSI
jgi:acyl transferase domain-containing protein